MRRAAGGLLLIALAATPDAQATQFQTRSELRAQLGAPALASFEDALPALLEADAAGLLARLRQSGDAVAAEHLLHTALLLLRARDSAGPALRAEVEMLSRHVAQVWTEPDDPDHGRGLQRIAFPVAAAARGSLRHWQRIEHAQAYRRALESGLYATLRTAVDEEALADAIAQLTPAALDALLAGGLEALPTAAVLAALARAPSAALYRRLLQLPVDDRVLAALAAVPQRLAPAQAFAVLRAAAQLPQAGSSAVLAMAALIESHPPAADFLFEGLVDAALGGSCAQALAASAAPHIVPRLQTLLDRSADGPAARRALLALRLSREAAARRILLSYADDPRRPAAVRAQVRAWLR